MSDRLQDKNVSAENFCLLSLVACGGSDWHTIPAASTLHFSATMTQTTTTNQSVRVPIWICHTPRRAGSSWDRYCSYSNGRAYFVVFSSSLYILVYLLRSFTTGVTTGR